MFIAPLQPFVNIDGFVAAPPFPLRCNLYHWVVLDVQPNDEGFACLESGAVAAPPVFKVFSSCYEFINVHGSWSKKNR
ncbi:MAG: hypothetical protein JXO49_03535 [Deltaproteobacteria bacterium]|nr:hypothetical protein [Deltaproteobacteria bacterium]